MTGPRPPAARFALSAGLGLLLAGCGGLRGTSSALDPAGVQADRIARLWWLTFWVCLVTYVAVMAFVLGAAAFRRGGSDAPELYPPAKAERRRLRVIAGAVAATVVVLFVILIEDFRTGRAIHALDVPDAAVVRVTGHQWWWEVEYRGSGPAEVVTTANEIHLPVGRPVRFELLSNDVIHSFWIPNLHGKRDMIPGHPTTAVLRADRPGEFRGQCAEFCGLQHANMRLVVVAEPEEEFRAWLEARRKPAAEPATDAQRRGRDVLLGSSCVLCHNVSGTAARGRVGPDLTHVGGRPRIAAGVLPTTRGHLAGWVADPQAVKPGAKMPANPLPPADLRALTECVESLK